MLIVPSANPVGDADAVRLTDVLDLPFVGLPKAAHVLFRLSETPGGVRWTGRSHGADTDRILGSLGLTAEEIAALRERGVV